MTSEPGSSTTFDLIVDGGPSGIEPTTVIDLTARKPWSCARAAGLSPRSAD